MWNWSFQHLLQMHQLGVRCKDILAELMCITYLPKSPSDSILWPQLIWDNQSIFFRWTLMGSKVVLVANHAPIYLMKTVFSNHKESISTWVIEQHILNALFLVEISPIPIPPSILPYCVPNILQFQKAKLS